MKIEDWNECLKYAKSKCNEYENLKMVTYEMWDGRKGIKFFTLDCFGNPYNTYNTGTKKNKREMKNAIDISIEKLMQ